MPWSGIVAISVQREWAWNSASAGQLLSLIEVCVYLAEHTKASHLQCYIA